MPTTPDFLRGTAVAQIIGTMANVHEGGGPLVDDRQIIAITVEEKDAAT